MPLTKDQILSADDLKRTSVSVPEWGGEVSIRTMTGAERDAYESDILQQNGDNVELNRANARAKLVARTLCDENGLRLFTDADIELLGGKSAAALERCYEAASRLNKISKQDEAELLKK